MIPRLALGLALFAVLLAGLALYRTFSPAEPDPGHSAETTAPESIEHEGGEHGELAPHMAALQRFAAKLHHAGASENWPLAGFYEHEIEEVAEAIVAGGFEEDGHDIGSLVERMLLPAVERTGEAITAGSAADFEAAYGALVTACNACHEATDHGFVQIVVPDGNAYPNQDFTP